MWEPSSLRPMQVRERAIATRRSGVCAKLCAASRQKPCAKCLSVWPRTRAWFCSNWPIACMPCVLVLKKDIFLYPQLPSSKKSWPWLWKRARSMRRWPVAWVCRASSPSWKTWPLKYWNQTNTPGSSPRLRRRANSGAHTSSASVPCWTTKWPLLA